MKHPFETRLAPTALVLIGISVLTTASVRGAEPKEFTNSIGMKLVWIEPGSFLMGQDGPAADYHMTKHPAKFDDADWDDKPAHKVTIIQPFYMAATEVTLGQSRNFDPDLRKDDPDADAALHGIRWTQAVAFCELVVEEGRPDLSPADRGGVGVRLPGGHDHALPHRRLAAGRFSQVVWRSRLPRTPRRQQHTTDSCFAWFKTPNSPFVKVSSRARCRPSYSFRL